MNKSILWIVTTIAVLTTLGATISSLNISPVYADANCDEAGFGGNPQGNFKGNVKHCAPQVGIDDPKEPVRDCDSANWDKDNDGDGDAFCIDRGD